MKIRNRMNLDELVIRGQRKQGISEASGRIVGARNLPYVTVTSTPVPLGWDVIMGWRARNNRQGTGRH